MENELRELLKKLDNPELDTKEEMIFFLQNYKDSIDSIIGLSESERCEMGLKVGKAIDYLENSYGFNEEAKAVVNYLKSLPEEELQIEIKKINDAINDPSKRDDLFTLDEHFDQGIDQAIRFNVELLDMLDKGTPKDIVKDLIEQENPCISAIDQGIKSIFSEISSQESFANSGLHNSPKCNHLRLTN